MVRGDIGDDEFHGQYSACSGSKSGYKIGSINSVSSVAVTRPPMITV
jgi:hypothetical protein